MRLLSLQSNLIIYPHNALSSSQLAVALANTAANYFIEFQHHASHSQSFGQRGASFSSALWRPPFGSCSFSRCLSPSLSLSNHLTLAPFSSSGVWEGKHAESSMADWFDARVSKVTLPKRLSQTCVGLFSSTHGPNVPCSGGDCPASREVSWGLLVQRSLGRRN